MSAETLEFLIPFAIFGFIVCLFVGIIIASVISGKKRREAWQEVAQTLGFTYTERDTSIPGTYSGLKLFMQGRSQRAEHVLRGSHGGITALLLDYQYTTGSGKNSSTHFHTLCIIEDDGLDLPDILLRRQVRFFDFLGKLFGGQDVNFDDDPAFSESFVLQGSDEEALRKLFTSAIRARFVENKEKAYQVMGKGNVLILSYMARHDPRLTPDMLKDAFALATLFKSA